MLVNKKFIFERLTLVDLCLNICKSENKSSDKTERKEKIKLAKCKDYSIIEELERNVLKKP